VVIVVEIAVQKLRDDVRVAQLPIILAKTARRHTRALTLQISRTKRPKRFFGSAGFDCYVENTRFHNSFKSTPTPCMLGVRINNSLLDAFASLQILYSNST
jgi:hypothetical protein